MASYTIALQSTPVHVSFSNYDDALAVLYNDGMAQVWELHTRLPDPKLGSRIRGGGKVAEPGIRWEGTLAPDERNAIWISKQVALERNGEVAAMFWSGGGDEPACVLVIMDLNFNYEHRVDPDAHRLLPGENGWVVLDSNGSLKYGTWAGLQSDSGLIPSSHEGWSRGQGRRLMP